MTPGARKCLDDVFRQSVLMIKQPTRPGYAQASAASTVAEAMVDRSAGQVTGHVGGQDGWQTAGTSGWESAKTKQAEVGHTPACFIIFTDINEQESNPHRPRHHHY
jgi:hypothetical protein